ncbi:MAG: peptidylprolyl isomerase [Anaerolineae bacterium]|nr:peptidylprolyl isomerase [Anaerolineae bacterium]
MAAYTRLHRFLYVLLAGLVIALAACGSGDDASSERPPTVTPAGDADATDVADAIDGQATAVEPSPENGEQGEPLAGHALGPDDATVTIIMYGDFQCPACAQTAHNLEVLRDRYPDDIRLVWRHLPDPRSYDKSTLALQASEAAAAQDAFWQMHDQLFTHQADWIDLSENVFRDRLTEYAAIIGLDVDQFDTALDDGTYQPVIEQAAGDAAALDIVGVPTVLINGVPFSGRDDLFGLDEAVRLALLKKRQFDAPPDMTIDPAISYRATITTARGDIVIELFPRDAPQAVNNFVFLARQGWYNDITFHYVVPDFLAQTGDPSDTGRGGPGYTIADEFDNGLTFDREGLVAMAHPGGAKNSAGSAFFITLAPLRPADEWDGQYTIFGIVVDGMDMVRSLTPRNANDQVLFPNPPPGDRVSTITIKELEP